MAPPDVFRRMFLTRIFENKYNVYKSKPKDAAVVVQTFVRGAQARRNYAVLVVEHREAAKLENQILALQRKLEEEREARLQMEAVCCGSGLGCALAVLIVFSARLWEGMGRSYVLLACFHRYLRSILSFAGFCRKGGGGGGGRL